MQKRFWDPPVKIVLSVLAGQFVADWLWGKGLIDAVHRFPKRCIGMFAIVFIWSAIRRWRFERKRPFR